MDHTQYTINKAERKPGKHLTREDRGAIEAMKKLGQSNRAIARYLNCSPTTVSNELKRGTRPRTGRRGAVFPATPQNAECLYIKRTEQTATSHTAYVNAAHLLNGS